jgi:hypothetical protein
MKQPDWQHIPLTLTADGQLTPDCARAVCEVLGLPEGTRLEFDMKTHELRIASLQKGNDHAV